MALTLGRALWRQLPPAAAQASAAVGGRPAPIDFPAAVKKIDALHRVERKPWLMLGDIREGLQGMLGLETDELLIALAHWLQCTAGVPAAVGLAHSSGNIYFGPALELGSRALLPEETLVANLYTHGEMGLDAFASFQPPDGLAFSLMHEVATSKRMRWLDANLVSAQAEGAPLGEATPREPGSVIRTAKPKLFKKYPLLVDAVAPECREGGEVDPGLCMSHPSYKYLDLEGDGMDEWHVSLTRNAATRGYGASGAAAPAGLAALTRSNHLWAGYSVGTRSGLGALSPLETASVSLGASGYSPADIVKVLWTDSGAPEAADLRRRDEALLKELAPDAAFEHLAWVSE